MKIKNPLALSWKHPSVQGIRTRNGEVIQWPSELPELTQELLDSYDAEFEQHVSDTAYIEHRKADYPPDGDQLDVIWKQFNQMRLNGIPLIQEADDMLGDILNTKKKYKNPKDN